MAKKRARAAPVKNPLVQAFGILIQTARKKEQKSSEDLAADLGISASLLRLIESGSAALQPNRSIELIKALPNTQIEFRQLAVLLVACLISESRWSDEKARQQAISGFAELDRGLGVAIQPLKKVWASLISGSDSQRRAVVFERLAMPERLLEFLAQKTDPTPDSVTPLAEQWWRKLIIGTPPMYLDLMETIVMELKQFPPKLTASEIAEWETGHVGRFLRIYAVLETVNVLPATYKKFDWRFIENVGLRVISLATPPQRKHEKKWFADFLKELNKEKWMGPEKGKSAEEICELRFADEKSSYVEKFSMLLKRDQQADKPSANASFKNAWIYEVRSKTAKQSDSGYHLATIDDLVIDTDENFEVKICSWEETENWTKLLQSFWPD